MSRTAASVLGIRSEALPAWISLGRVLEDMADQGRAPVCQQTPDDWSSDATPAVRAEAAEACGFCPAVNACGAFADTNLERSGIWGGRDRTPTPRRKEASRMTSYTLTNAPGHHEARALATRCPGCGATTEPAAVLDRSTSREAGYNCRCGSRFTRDWPAA